MFEPTTYRRSDSHHMSPNLNVYDGQGRLRQSIPTADPLTQATSLPNEQAVLFNAIFCQITERLPFKESWSNGTGYFDGVMHDEELNECLNPGERACFVDPHGRKAIILKTRFGLAVIFERYKGPNNRVFARHLSDELRKLELVDVCGGMSLQDMRTLLMITQLSGPQAAH